MANSLPQSLPEALELSANLTKERLDELLGKKIAAEKLREAMRYSALGAGKKLRPFLLFATLDSLGCEVERGLNLAAAIEMIHVYSLIHDDLPAMDDDDFRRGSPSCHKKFDEATAILAGDALLTFAFQILSSRNSFGSLISSEQQLNIIELTAKYGGMEGMVGGQALDLQWTAQNKTASGSLKSGIFQENELDKALISKLLEHKKCHISPEIAEVLQIHHLKTGMMFVLAVESAAILAGAEKSIQKKLKNFAHYFGLAFQLADDFDDYKNKTKADSELNLVAKIGGDSALEIFLEFKKLAKAELKGFIADSSLLCLLIDWLEVG
jgi:geranylgeranyl pyrophosphate synthase